MTAPTPAAAGLALTPMIMSFVVGDGWASSWLLNAVFVVFVAVMMVSRVPTYSIKRVRIKPEMVLPILLVASVVIIGLVVESWLTLSVIGLLYGESGTGKTLAAEAMATRLHLPMLSVDLSLVVSKYIGETEKNLSELFAAAEGYAALLFFDEADALFGKRTNVQDAHDRYANIEVNYLLQRLESFEGCALLATNLMQGVDDAFMRRFDQVVHFPRPGVAERVAIWRGQLPAQHLSAQISIEQLAERFDLTGGEIRNAALSAAYMAADGGTVVTEGMIDAAVAEEFSKLGRPFPRRQGAYP